MLKKKTRRISNWSEYNKALVNRGSLTVWFDKDTVESWFNTRVLNKRGRPVLYSDKVNLPKQKGRNKKMHIVVDSTGLKVFGEGEWKVRKKKNNYHRRSLSETAMFRFKQLFGNKVDARTIERQSREIGIKCSILNKMNQLGMPKYAIC